MSIAITGATGQLGRLVLQSLLARGASSDIIALVRSASKASDLGVTVREADYNSPDALDPALQGVDTLLLISGNEIGQRVAQHRNVIAAAQRQGVGRIVYTSILRADVSPISLAAEHFATEEAILESGIPYTLLRNGWYTENYTGLIPGAIAGGAFLGSAGEGKISWATRVDFAEAAAVVLTGSGHENKTYELAGDVAETLTDLAAELSRQTGKDIPYRDLPEAEYAALLVQFGVPEGFAPVIAGWDVAVSQGALYDDGHQLSALIGRPTTPLTVAVAEALAALKQ